MSVSGILSSSFSVSVSITSVSSTPASSSSVSSTQSPANTRQEIQQDFEQLGQALQSGNLTAAQQDFATLEQLLPQNNSTSANANSPLSQAFSQLSQDLQSGNLTAAQQAYATIQQDFQGQAAHWQGHHHHHHADGEAGSFGQLFSQLGQDLQSGNLTAAQKAFAALQQDLAPWTASNGQSQPAQSSSTSASAS
ncbi:MAG TPA: hypothetical protein VEK33_07075 [Terriglobales bacterium]|nr:hypothetical protein [Terriglobales bacterium]